MQSPDAVIPELPKLVDIGFCRNFPKKNRKLKEANYNIDISGNIGRVGTLYICYFTYVFMCYTTRNEDA